MCTPNIVDIGSDVNSLVKVKGIDCECVFKRFGTYSRDLFDIHPLNEV